jgi:hypothetical protein
MIIDTQGRNLLNRKEFPSSAENSLLIITVVYSEIASCKMGTGTLFRV